MQILTILAILIAWLGCLAAYLTSERQCLLQEIQLSRAVGWSTFLVGLAASSVLLAVRYNGVAAVLMSMMFVMCLWPALILSAAHLRGRAWLLNGTAVVILVLIMGVG